MARNKKIRSNRILFKARKLQLVIILLLLIFLPVIILQLLKSQDYESNAQALNTTFSFGVTGDLGANNNTSGVLDAVNTSALNFFFALGDFSYNQVIPESSWCDYVKTRVGTTFPFELVAGNHEDDGPDGQITNFTNCLPDKLGSLTGIYPKEYYFDYPIDAPIARFIMISPNLTFPNEGTYSYKSGSPRYIWVANAIDNARASGIKWIIVGMHKYCFSLVTGNCEVGADIMNLLVDKKVDLYLQAHDHAYARSKQLVHGTLCSILSPGSYNSNCISDDGLDNIYSKGNGSILMTIGSGGRSLNSQNSTDAESGYFTKWMGSNSNPTYGFMKFTVSDSQIAAQFVKGTGLTGSFTENFTIIDSSMPTSTNYPTPTASAQATPTPFVQPSPTPTSILTPIPTSSANSVEIINTIADTYVASDNTSTNFGASTANYVDSSPIKTSYLKFDLSAFTGRTLKSAKLRLKTTSNTYSGSPNTQVIKTVPNSSWNEATMTYSNKPILSSSVLGSIANTVSNTVYEIPLNITYLQPVIGTIFSIGIDSSGSDAMYFSSKETVDKPQLILDF